MSNLIYPINLQLFAEGAPAEPAPVNPPPATAPAPAPTNPALAAPLSIDEQLTSLFNGATPADNPPPATPAPQTEPPATPAPEATPSPEQSLPENFKSVGEVVRSFKNAQSELTRKSQMVSDLTKSMEAMKNDYETRLQSLSQQPPAPAPLSPVDELSKLDTEAVLEKFYADPLGMLRTIAEQVTDGRVKPLETKIDPVIARDTAQQNLETWNEAVTSFNDVNPDMKEFLDGMKQYIAENNLQDSKEPGKVLQNAYTYAKGLKYSAPVDPVTFLNDPEFVSKNIMANPAIKDAIIKAYMAELNGVKVPPAISGSSNGASIATPPIARPNNIDEAGNQFESMLRGNFSK